MLSMLSLISRYAFDTFCISCITSSTSPNLNVLPVNLSYALIKSLSFKPFMNDCLSNAAAFILSELPSLLCGVHLINYCFILCFVVCSLVATTHAFLLVGFYNQHHRNYLFEVRRIPLILPFVPFCLMLNPMRL